jgi:hypothetical protein
VIARGEPGPQPAAGRQTIRHVARPGLLWQEVAVPQALGPHVAETGPLPQAVAAGPQALGAHAAAPGEAPQHAAACLIPIGPHVAETGPLPQAVS